MINLSETTPPSVSLHLALAQLIEKSIDLGNADRAARLEEMLSGAIAMMDRAAKAPAADLVSELIQCQHSLENLRVEAKANCESSEAAKVKLKIMIDNLKSIEF